MMPTDRIIFQGYLGKYTQHYKVYSPEGVSPTLAACDWRDPVKVDLDPESKGNRRIRHLTPREYMRLMGQKDDVTDRIFQAVPQRTTQYTLAGNSIVVEVLMAIFKGIYTDNSFEQKKKTLEDFL